MLANSDLTFGDKDQGGIETQTLRMGREGTVSAVMKEESGTCLH